ncbi:hypothetical protein BDK51DRAFT_43588 [Blyttiomyces helicus]|uniref:ABC transporter domain-containing protein n=1 Tax=Blyttiomyces helicus TaxID=388810 RepID=A0A4P9W682_9FUNG|nr:hypothetical protein BDK51DRAFT_43588 [Blyttiomyces helicus]|eukprot:RKO86428.1 hypothetical protein BDK51DRAFT_43588 [Blyttiomyces helicus]
MFNVITNAVFQDNAQEARDTYNANAGGFLANHKPVLTRMSSDWLFTCPAHQAVRTVSSAPGAGASLYFYFFEAWWTGGATDTTGPVCGHYACHTTDVGMLFTAADDAPTAAVTTTLRQYIAQFMTTPPTGNLGLTPNSLPAWPATSPSSLPVMRFPLPEPTGQYTPILEPSHPHTSACNFWDAAGYEYLENQSHIPEVINDPTLSPMTLTLAMAAVVFFLGCQAVLLVSGCMLRRRMGMLFSAVEGLDRKESMLRGSSDFVEQGVAPDELPMPVTVECRGLEYRVADRDDGKRLLNDVSVKFLPGTVTAIIGSSGAGKTTLLSLLNRRLNSPSAQGQIWMGGKPLSEMGSERFRLLTGFVAQHDAPYYGLTPREVMMFNAILELPASTTQAEKARRVNQILKMLNLSVCADVVIQRPEENKGGISGGQLRRLSIAIALLGKPSVLFMDEPTSGLDAKSSLDVGHVMADLAAQGYTIICSIHQPRTEMFDLFHQVTVLVHGRLLFTGTSSESIQHFSTLKGSMREVVSSGPLSRHEEANASSIDAANPADLILDVAGSITVEHVEFAISHFRKRTVAVDDFYSGKREVHSRFSSANVAPATGAFASKQLYPPPRMASVDRITYGESLSRVLIPSFNPLASSNGKFVPLGKPIRQEASQTDIGASRLWPIQQVPIVNARWWCTRPVLRKLNMMFVAVCGVWVLALVQRRSGSDALALLLQTKGLAIACIGLPALKNIGISFDYYEDRDVFNFDYKNGTVHPIAFFFHRLIYETSLATLESLLCAIFAYTILGCNPDLGRIATVLALFVGYYNCVTGLFTFIYSTRLGRPEARSVAFFTQGLLAICCGIWVKRGDSNVYDAIAWLQTINPTYWVLAPLIRANAAGAGECYVSSDAGCYATLGDFVVEESRADWFESWEALGALFVIWSIIRFIQLLLLLRDAYWEQAMTARKTRRGAGYGKH